MSKEAILIIGIEEALTSVDLPILFTKYIMAETSSYDEVNLRLDMLVKKRMRI